MGLGAEGRRAEPPVLHGRALTIELLNAPKVAFGQLEVVDVHPLVERCHDGAACSSAPAPVRDPAHALLPGRGCFLSWRAVGSALAWLRTWTPLCGLEGAQRACPHFTPQKKLSHSGLLGLYLPHLEKWVHQSLPSFPLSPLEMMNSRLRPRVNAPKNCMGDALPSQPPALPSPPPPPHSLSSP